MTGISQKTAVVVGAGPAGLMAADVLSGAGVAVTVVDRMPSVGRKFLMAGKSGLNLTKMENPAAFAAAFGTTAPAMMRALADFGPAEVVDWAKGLGQEVFTGSTGRVFPVAMKASPLLRAWLARLAGRDVTFHTRWTWEGWRDDALQFATPEGPRSLAPDITILACGGASWARLGSDGTWARHLDGVAPFRPANCGFRVNWSDHMQPFLGQPVKATRLTAGTATSRGEWIIGRTGIEGGGVYAVSAAVRDGADLFVDLLPDLTAAQIDARIAAAGPKASRSKILTSTLRLPAAKVALFNEMSHRSKDLPRAVRAATLKRLPLLHDGATALDQAISTAGGLRFDALKGFALRRHPGAWAAGEMLDWEAPTGGYLITACLASGRQAALQSLAAIAGPEPNQARLSQSRKGM
ncbi:TIGR03862 family flavoprotein [Loktanella sp. DJP18]|uniref:TIGR03862 family flavoprotein n=1 Tax=Loktanella sp. DJP18 TaxID=3409788 RepID=UPI003BB7AF68